MHVPLMRDFFVSEGRTNEQADSRSWIIDHAAGRYPAVLFGA